MSETLFHTSPETGNPHTYPRETFKVRQVSRLLDPARHHDDTHVANFRSDVEEMLADGEFYGLNGRDLRLLAHIYRACIRPNKESLEGAVVSLSDRQWSSFVGIRRKFIWHRRNPANLINLLRARRAQVEIESAEAVLSHSIAPTSTIENGTQS